MNISLPVFLTNHQIVGCGDFVARLHPFGLGCFYWGFHLGASYFIVISMNIIFKAFK